MEQMNAIAAVEHIQRAISEVESSARPQFDATIEKAIAEVEVQGHRVYYSIRVLCVDCEATTPDREAHRALPRPGTDYPKRDEPKRLEASSNGPGVACTECGNDGHWEPSGSCWRCGNCGTVHGGCS